jgi:carboxyl-terminal processing protease
MTLTLRGIVLLFTGVVLGIGLALGSAAWTALSTRAKPPVVLDPTIESAALVAEVIDRVRREYVDVVDDRQIVEGAIRGIVGELDPHSTFLDAVAYEDIRISTSGNYTGVGLDVDLEDGKVTVVMPLEGAPAARAGILPGDIVVAVNDIPVDSKDVEATVTRLRGEAGTPVTLDVLRPSTATVLKFALTRTEVHVKTVLGDYLGNGLGYIRVSSFSEGTAADLETVGRELAAEAGREELLGIVLDLRSNPGGLLDSAVAVADEFLAEGVVVSGTGRIRQSRFEQAASPGDPFENVPLVVLVNGASASAAEIVAGALQDHGRAHRRRNDVRKRLRADRDAARRQKHQVTTSRYLTPSGRSINGSGIAPDVVVASDDINRQPRREGRITAR